MLIPLSHDLIAGSGISPAAVRRSVLVVTSLAVVIGIANRAEAKIVPELQVIPPGTEVVDRSASRWNRLVLLSRPTLVGGDVEQIPAGVRRSVSRFSLTVMTTVRRSKRDAGAEPSAAERRGGETSPEREFRLSEVGVGYSARVGDRQVIVDVDSAERLGLDLSLIDRYVLDQNVERLSGPRVAARSSTLIIFDAPAILARGDDHRDATMRHLVWVDSDSGQTAVAAWFLVDREAAADDSPAVLRGEPLRVLPGGVREKRRIRVDGDEFFLGIPTERAFAMQSLPPGRPIAWTDRLASLASRRSYSPETLAEFTSSLNEAIAAK